MHLSRQHLRWGLLAISVAMYVYSLFLPALLFQHREALPGSHILAWGWWGMLLLEFAWFANPAYIVAILAYKRKNNRLSKQANIAAIVLGLTSFHAKEWWFNEGSGTPIVGLGTGYYVWMLSFCILLVGCLVASAPNPPLNTDAPPNGGAPVS